MARPLPPIEEALAGELFDHFLDFIEIKGGIPIERTFWRWLIRHNRYSADELPEPTFRWQFGRLQREGYIKVDPETRILVPTRNCKVLVNR